MKTLILIFITTLCHAQQDLYQFILTMKKRWGFMRIDKPFIVLKKQQKCVSHFLFYYFQYCVSKVGKPVCKPVLMFANVLWLCVCLPLHNASILPQMLMGQIAQNRCYKLAAVN